MKRVFIDIFCGIEVYTVLWGGKPCWFATKIAETLDYDDPSKAISYCLKVEEFDIGIDYDVLTGKELREFKDILKENNIDDFKYISKLIIFYEDGLFGFLQFSHKPIGAKLRKWIRKEVKPRIKEELRVRENTIPLINSDISKFRKQAFLTSIPGD
ncbi:MAG: BRO-N domain-containing protein [Sarcina sp.]